ncbi:hypothetical protein SK128_012970 [Halocaridina rubra]|uniref:K Homology domain-containing protein n=1 Tax=Halocaridina rubra TaxID=373956 RepID=A0AAN8XKQ6_HALRR
MGHVRLACHSEWRASSTWHMKLVTSLLCERVLTIGGSEEVVLKVLAEVLECLDEVSGVFLPPDGEAQQKGNTETDARILVHQSQAGCVIGKGGSKIKELREVSCIIHLDSVYFEDGEGGSVWTVCVCVM